MRFDEKTFQISEAGNFGKIALGVGILGLVLSGVGLLVDRGQFFHSYLTAYVFWLTIGLGGLFMTMLHHLTGAVWSVILRRITETIMIVLPVMIIFFIPLIFGMKDLYNWADPSQIAHDSLLAHKQPYLNLPFFLIRVVIYFAIWSILGLILYRTSLKQDEEHQQSLTDRMRALSAPGMLLFALSLTFASFDWLMSMEAKWYSTIFGVYIFAGSFVAVVALITLMVLCLRKNGILAEQITFEHYHYLGKLMFAFTIFWAYIAFSQFMLIWYANIPEETMFYMMRWEGSWNIASLFLVVGNFAIPFLVLIMYSAKRNFIILTVMSFWLLFAHWIDLYWIVMPNFHHDGIHLSWMDATTMIGIGGIFLWLFWQRLTSKAIAPLNDPKLGASIRFINQLSSK